MDNPTPAYDLTEYEDKWIAISESEGRVIAVGDDAYEVSKRAEDDGYMDPLVLKVPSSRYGYIPST